MTNEALLLALALSRTLSRPKSRESIVAVADQLRKLRGMLRDIGMPKEVLKLVSERRLEVAEVTAGAFGDEEWVLHDLWQCAADYVWELDNYEEEEAAATKAANAARQLISINFRHTNFYLACRLVTISNVQREIGEFPAALDTSREALAVARKLKFRDSRNIYFCIDALACHARSLVDDDAYDDATALLHEAISVMSSNDASSWANLGKFGVVHAHAAISGRPSFNEVISACRAYTSLNCARPFWLSSSFSAHGDDIRAWLLLICSVMECTTSPFKAQASAKESLTLMSQYYERTQADMAPYAKASVLGHQYILLSILRDREQGQSVLNETITLFRRVLDDDPPMARLPLIVFLDILLVLFRPLSLRFETITLRRWKKSVYEGSTAFFEDFVAFLEGLPRYTHPKV